MTNKEKLKIAIEEDIDQKKHYNEIIKKIKKGEKMKNKNIWSLSLVPICLIVLISGIIFLNNKNNEVLKNKTYKDKENNITLNINEIHSISEFKLDADLKSIIGDNNDFVIPYQIVKIPNDLNKTFKYIIYTKDKNNKKYNVLHDYIIEYTNDNDRIIKVTYSKEYKPLRDYHFSEEKSKKTIINGVDLKIYKFKNTFFTEFKYNGYNFDIETFKVTEQELSNFLSSILN